MLPALILVTFVHGLSPPMDGVGILKTGWGVVGPFLRPFGYDFPVPDVRPSPRLVSNTIHQSQANESMLYNPAHVNALALHFGQWISHDFGRTSLTNKSDVYNISVPTCDAALDRQCLANQSFSIVRGDYVLGSDGRPIDMNAQPSFLHVRQIYGSSEVEVRLHAQLIILNRACFVRLIRYAALREADFGPK